MRKSQVRRTRRGGKMSIDITRQKGQGKEEETRAQGACEKEILTERKRRRTRSGRSQRERERRGLRKRMWRKYCCKFSGNTVSRIRCIYNLINKVRCTR
jgi:hypothetical protein